MKTLCVIGVVGLVLLLTAAPCAEAAGDSWDGNKLLENCRDGIRLADAGRQGSAQVNYNAGYCAGFVDGMLDMHSVYAGSMFCIPYRIRMIQAMRIVVHYLETHPERLHLQQSDLAIEAFRDAFPCPPAASRPQR